MLQFKNGTPFAGTILLLPDQEGIDSIFTIVKATFTLQAPSMLAADQVPVTRAPSYHAEPDWSSISQPSDLSLMKPATDVLLVGQAHAPGGRSIREMEVTLTAGRLSKTVRVFGDRNWRVSGPVSMTAPAPFDTMPLVWERAYGGTDRIGDELHAEHRNPVGLGFRVERGETALDGLPLPNLEDPANLISSWDQRPPPACFAPVAPHWEPRRSYAGTYDEAWQRSRGPYLPVDFDARFFQLAPPGLVADGYFKGGESIEVTGATPSGWLEVTLPSVDVQVTYVIDGISEERTAVLDTVILEPDADRVQLVWRAVISCDKKALRVSEIRAEASGFAGA